MRRISIIVLLIVPPILVIFLYLPSLDLSLTGDDYQWLKLAHEAVVHPRMLFADLDTFYRPTNTWTMIVERYLWGTIPAGFHLSNVLLHSTASLLLLFLCRRFGLSWITSLIVALLWGCSPFSAEPAMRVASRHEDLLLIGWLGMILAWPKRDERWSAGKLGAVFFFVSLALFSKETWIVTPGIALVLDLSLRKLPMKRSLSFLACWLSLSGLYILVHHFVFPSTREYFELALPLLAKVPHQLSAFFYFETLMPMAFPFTWKSILALAIVSVIIVFAFKWRSTPGILGTALLVLPMIPTLFIPYLPTRYTAIPYAGFLLLLASLSESLVRSLTITIQRAVASLLLVLSAAMLLAGMLIVRAECHDAKRVSLAHEKLLIEADAIAHVLPLDRPVLVIRGEDENPLREIARTALGLPKIYYVRHADPYGLIDTAALFEWVIDKKEVLIDRFDDWEERYKGREGAVLVHRSDGFIWISENVSDIARVARQYSEMGFPVRLIEADIISSSR